MKTLIRELPAIIGVSAAWGVIIFIGTLVFTDVSVVQSASSGLGAAAMWLVIILCWRAIRAGFGARKSKAGMCKSGDRNWQR
ncbi:hypothetical protein ACFW40_34405 [Streptomyces sp. NPDC058807]|uniref:hypothetical protein n=1 Tax=unclassified Streptomyces TaxID=2593676 RepID=UPI0036B55152